LHGVVHAVGVHDDGRDSGAYLSHDGVVIAV
jgi:hypothetical protein